MSSVVWYKHIIHVKSVKKSKPEQFEVFYMVRFIFNLKHRESMNASPEKKHPG